MLDLAIIGGGPAGCAAALEARGRGLRVALWERDRFPHHKVCGEFISSEALPWLQHLIPLTMAHGSAIHAAEFITENGLRRVLDLPSAARGLSRRLLDASLWKAAAEAGVEAHEGEGIRRVQRLSRPKGIEVWELESAGGLMAQAKTLIVACGRWWALEGFPSPARPSTTAEAGEWIGAKAHFAGVERRASVEMYLFRGGYCGLAPIEDSKYNVCCLVHRDCLRRAGMKSAGDFSAWLRQVSDHPALAARVRAATQVSPVVTTAPVRLERRSPTQDGALLVGDASGFLDPFTGEGISMALHSGRLAGEAIAESFEGMLGAEQAVQTYRLKLDRAVKESYRVAGLARTLIQAPGWVRSLSSLPFPWLGGWLQRKTRWRGAVHYECL